QSDQQVLPITFGGDGEDGFERGDGLLGDRDQRGHRGLAEGEQLVRWVGGRARAVTRPPTRGSTLNLAIGGGCGGAPSLAVWGIPRDVGRRVLRGCRVVTRGHRFAVVRRGRTSFIGYGCSNRTRTLDLVLVKLREQPLQRIHIRGTSGTLRHVEKALHLRGPVRIGRDDLEELAGDLAQVGACGVVVDAGESAFALSDVVQPAGQVGRFRRLPLRGFTSGGDPCLGGFLRVLALLDGFGRGLHDGLDVDRAGFAG